MKYTQRTICLLLAILLLYSLAACQQAPAETTTAPAETTAAPTETTAAPTETTAPEETTEPTKPLTEEELILQERRDIVEAYMRQQTTILWRSEEDVLYTLASNTVPEESDENKQIQLVAGRLYRGMPYSYGSGTMRSLADFAQGEPDSNGIYTLSGLTWEALSGGGGAPKIGNDCSCSVVLAWSQIGASVTAKSTQLMCRDYGFLPVGDYEIIPSTNEPTSAVIALNGAEKMYAAYTQLQKGDALVRRATGGGHAAMVVDVEVVYQDSGAIDPLRSYVTILEQTSTNAKNSTASYNHEVTGEPVYEICNTDRVWTFNTLLKKAYLPITCKELIDPSPLPEKTITDSQTELNKDTLLTGTLSSKWFIDAVTVTIADGSGNTVQEAMAFPTRGSNHDFDLQKFVTDHPNAIRGSIDPAALASGNYHCTVVCRLTTGEEFTVRDFDFTV